MANIRRHPRAHLADVQCSRLTFEPGDRIIVRTHQKLDRDQQRKLRRSIRRFAGCEVEVLIINLLEMDIEVIKANTLG